MTVGFCVKTRAVVSCLMLNGRDTVSGAVSDEK